MRNSFSPPTPPIPSKIRANPRNPWSSSEGCSPRRLSPPTTCCPRIDTNIHEYERNSCAFVNGRGRSQAVLREVVHEVLQQPRVVGAVDAARLEENHVGRDDDPPLADLPGDDDRVARPLAGCVHRERDDRTERRVLRQRNAPSICTSVQPSTVCGSRSDTA